MPDVLENLYAVALKRRDEPLEGSYTRYLYEQGLDKILKKVAEECAETIIAAKNADNSETVYEICDLFYHLLILMVHSGISLDEVYAELEARTHKTANLKKMRDTDKNT